jgi:hypothetical protein
MNGVVFEHAPVTELPEQWRTKLANESGTRSRFPRWKQERHGSTFQSDDRAC